LIRVKHLSQEPDSQDFSSYGFRRLDNPIKDKKIFLSNSFLDRYHDEITMKHCELLIKYGRATRCYDIKDADFCLVGQTNGHIKNSSRNVPFSSERQEFAELSGIYVVDWTEFIDLLFPPYYETFMRKVESQNDK
jgi:hypothetical protein